MSMRSPEQQARPRAEPPADRLRRRTDGRKRGDEHERGRSQPTGRGGDRRRLWLIVAIGAMLIVAAAGSAALLDRTAHDTSDATVPIAGTVPLDAWTPYWALDRALPALSTHADSIRHLSPFWYLATAAGTIAADPHAPAASTTAMINAARAHGMTIIPSVLDGMKKGEMAAVLADPTTRGQHVEALVRFAASGKYDGLDIDYEQFAFNDDRTDWPEIRPNWVAFITELAARLHADGRQLTVSIPPIYDDGSPDDSGYWVYDYGAIAPHVDAIRIMAYDYSTAEPGPIAPLTWVRQAIEGAKRATKAPEKLVLGIPLYGYNWPTGVDGDCPDIDREGRTTVTTASAHDLALKRGVTPVHDVANGEWTFTYGLVVTDGTRSCTQQREVHYVDSDGARQRIDLARQAHLAGVSLWAFGYDDAEVWQAIGPVIAPAP
jgi:spore germination protein YaaH